MSTGVYGGFPWYIPVLGLIKQSYYIKDTIPYTVAPEPVPGTITGISPCPASLSMTAETALPPPLSGGGGGRRRRRRRLEFSAAGR